MSLATLITPGGLIREEGEPPPTPSSVLPGARFEEIKDQQMDSYYVAGEGEEEHEEYDEEEEEEED